MASDARWPVELVVLVASAGGLDALSTVLGNLPTEFPAGIVVQQHLGDHDSALPTILRRLTARQVSWVRDRQSLAPGHVLVCPPRMHLELTPQGRCGLRDLQGLGVRRFDVLLRSIARSYGPRSVAVVLSGSGRDGAAGTAAMKRAGAIVIAESPKTALYSSMPTAAARAGADVMLPAHQIGRVLAGIVAGAPLPEWPLRKGTSAPWRTPAQAVGGGAVPGLLRDEVMNSAGGRAELARLRADELNHRRKDLSAGWGATAQTVATAQRRAAESRRRAQLAHQAAQEAAARWGH